MEKETEAFRNEVMLWRGGRRRGARPYTTATRAKALQLVARLRAGGLSMEAAAECVGVSASTLYAWREPKAQAGLVPVRVLPEARASASVLAVRLLSPRGYRVEVADVASAVALLRELG